MEAGNAFKYSAAGNYNVMGVLGFCSVLSSPEIGRFVVAQTAVDFSDTVPSSRIYMYIYVYEAMLTPNKQ